LTFKWSELSELAKKEAREHILSNPYPCDDCGDTYNKDDLIDHFRQGYKICKNCIDEYILIHKGVF
jgi:hypothetical protein